MVKILTALTLALTAACGSSSSQTPTSPPASVSLPEAEKLQRSANLKVSIRLEPDTVDVGQTPAVIARFENVGSTDIYLNPHLITGVYLPDRDQPIRCVTNLDYGLRLLSAEDFVRLAPAGAWEQRIAYRERKPGEPSTGLPPGVQLTAGPITRGAPPGTHRVSLRYMNYPDCRHVRYDPYTIGIPVWEGRIDAPAVSLTIRPLPPAAEQALIARVERGTASDLEYATLGAQNTAAANAAVIDYLATHSGELWRFSRWIQERSDCRAWTAVAPAIDRTSDLVQPLLKDAMLALGTRCPAMLADLRRLAADPLEKPEVRQQSARLLGIFAQREDVPLLISVLRGSSPPSTNRDALARSGAVEALANIGGDEANAALIEALADPAFSRLHHDIVVFLPRAGGGADAVAAFTGQLKAANSNIVVRAMIGLEQLQARSAIPDLVRLLHHQNATIRAYAASTLRRMADESLQSEMRAALNDPDQNVQKAALWYLAQKGDASLAPLFEARLGSPDRSIHEFARMGLQRVGTPASVPRIRPLLESPSEAVRRSTTLVLEMLTFRTWQPSNGEELRPSDVDAWWVANKNRSRRDWAMDAIGRPSTANAYTWWPPRTEKIRALEFLDAQRDSSLALNFRTLTTDSDWAVRVRAAEALARFDKATAMRLLVREFDNRAIAACMVAHDTLRRLTSENLQVDCESPDARTEAAKRWMATAK